MGILTDGKYWLLRWPGAGEPRSVPPYAYALMNPDARHTLPNCHPEPQYVIPSEAEGSETVAASYGIVYEHTLHHTLVPAKPKIAVRSLPIACRLAKLEGIEEWNNPYGVLRPISRNAGILGTAAGRSPKLVSRGA